jgi:CxxC-x17-CxxC domain-containing protein
LRFRPPRGERITCPQCFSDKIDQREKPRNPHGTRTMFQIECVECGRQETVDFVPSSLSETTCSKCFEAKKERR